ncbi:MAG TPA: hypothetical protein VN258_15320 [Mobilitalea sp.]|nr:hypothetical protein [Mobilitalea sp.]
MDDVLFRNILDFFEDLDEIEDITDHAGGYDDFDDYEDFLNSDEVFLYYE